MGSAKHEKTFVDLDKSYEQNVIGIRGIVYFGVGLFFLIVVAFGLMWALQLVLEDNAVQTRDKSNPMMLKDKERLPPEPRLQGAPGFGVDSPDGRISLELTIPQAEYRTLSKIWDEQLEKGQKSGETVVTLPINEAKNNLLQKNPTPAGVTDENLKKSRMILSDSSAGRLASEVRR